MTLLTYKLLCFASLLFYALSLLSKEMAVTLPLILILFDKIILKTKNNLFKLVFNLYFFGFVVVTLLYASVRFYYLHNPIENEFLRWSLNDRLFAIPWIILSYFKMVLFPISLSAEHKIFPPSIGFFIFSSFIVGLVIYLTIIRSRSKFIQFGFLFFIITLLPVYNIIPIANPFAERYLYLPSVGFVILFEASLDNIKINRLFGRFHQLFFLMLIGIFSLLLIERNIVWKNEYELWSDAVKKMPNSGRAHNNLGKAYTDLGRLNDAVKEILLAIKLNPKEAQFYFNLGIIYNRLGQNDEAIQQINKGLKLVSNDYSAHFLLGNIYAEKSMWDWAGKEYKIAITLKPDSVDAINHLGNVFFMQDKLDMAILQYSNVLKLDPKHFEARNNLTLALEKKESNILK